jgi:broad specificity phosphatase PhoE
MAANMANGTSELWLVRHGETEWNRQGLYQGQVDIPLNETGLAQAHSAADRLAAAGVAFDALYASPLLRARQTAEVSAALLKIEMRFDRRLMEIHQGSFEGKRYAHVLSEFGTLLKNLALPAVHRRAPGGESVAEVAARMAEAASEITRAHPGGRVLIFAHGLALATLICQARAIPLEKVYSHIQENAAVEVIRWEGLSQK